MAHSFIQRCTHKLASYLRLSLFMLGVLVGVQVPGFVDQYGKNLEARLLESSQALNQFQADADKFFDGDISKLIAYYQDKNDAVFNAGANSITAIASRQAMLKQAWQDFNQSTLMQFQHVALAPINDIRSQVWQSYEYLIVLNPLAIGFGLVAGLLMAIIIDLVSGFLLLIVRSLSRSKQSAQS
ncbi:DUF2937 family protein [Pseudoalteromonas ulvae]|uniref:DUF2937 domain-containing protein n=1 Tax=Pseudoalteromonas ulvae TaxID=107327 RepID=A0A244CW55_PSEDV|nr:DUF2937 family protein [Pseudoalteromonas ulvae]OUL59821.1 hypothetical protein B1199_05220 [Pseudoalteromonas ulvae]